MCTNAFPIKKSAIFTQIPPVPFSQGQRYQGIARPVQGRQHGILPIEVPQKSEWKRVISGWKLAISQVLTAPDWASFNWGDADWTA